MYWDPRTITADDPGGRHVETLAYTGVILAYHKGGAVVAKTWVPVGQEPTFTDDELLMAALGTAWRWNQRTV